MSLTKDKKHEVVDQIGQLLSDAKLTVVAKYEGTTVKAMQDLRKQAKDTGTMVHVVKNRLVIKAVESNEALKSVDTSALRGQLLYAFNSEDEVAPAQVLANFAKLQPQLQFVGAITADGKFLGADDVKALASLPSKDQLRAQLVGTIGAPLSGFVNVLSGNLRGFLNVLSAKAELS
ncbi:MAG TPA: 50S ribosomal protein L10 [Patescibacteria group bacterium]|nr:50S ribosomal protein L10 [Patescibacteria group bacterium]